jgi:hypothetical protein
VRHHQSAGDHCLPPTRDEQYGRRSCNCASVAPHRSRRTTWSIRHGQYHGKNKWGRYALIGGRSLQWALRYCWPGRQRKLAIQLLFGTSPMIAVALANKLLRTFRRKDGLIVLHQLNDKNSISSQSDFQESQGLTVAEIEKIITMAPRCCAWRHAMPETLAISVFSVHGLLRSD